jgi:hypothetical protein
VIVGVDLVLGVDLIKLLWSKLILTFCKLDHFISSAIFIELLWKDLAYKMSK